MSQEDVKVGTFHKVCARDDIDLGKCKAFEVDGHQVMVARTKNDEFYAVTDICSHGDARLSEGRVRGHHIMCPLHGARFDLKDGSYGPPAYSPIKTYDLRIEGDDVEVLILEGDDPNQEPAPQFYF